LKARLAAGKPAVGLWLFFDMEHGPIGIESAHAI
jgi:hypothetical protein